MKNNEEAECKNKAEKLRGIFYVGKSKIIFVWNRIFKILQEKKFDEEVNEQEFDVQKTISAFEAKIMISVQPITQKKVGNLTGLPRKAQLSEVDKVFAHLILKKFSKQALQLSEGKIKKTKDVHLLT